MPAFGGSFVNDSFECAFPTVTTPTSNCTISTQVAVVAGTKYAVGCDIRGLNGTSGLYCQATWVCF
jgi:hypothetical protein